MQAPDQEEPKKKRGCGSKVLIGCGVLALLGVLAVVGGGYWLYSKGIKTDPAEVAALTQEIVPGAKIPDGYQGFMGFDMFGFKMAMIGPPGMTKDGSDAGNLMIVASVPADKASDVKNEVAKQSGRGEGEAEDVGTETITVAGHEVEFQKSRFVQDDTKTLQIVGVLPESGGRVALLMFMGPEDSFDRPAMDAFLASIANTASDAE